MTTVQPGHAVQHERNAMHKEGLVRVQSTSDNNVLLVANYAPDVGFAWWLMEHFWSAFGAIGCERKIKVLVAYPALASVPQFLETANIEAHVLDVTDSSALGVLEVLRSIRRLRVRTLYLTDWPYFDLRYLLFRAAGVRRIIIHDHSPGDRPPLRGLRAALKRLRNGIPGMVADSWIAISPLMVKRAVENTLVPKRKISLVLNGIEPVSRAPESRERVLRAFGFEPDRRIVVTVGRAHPIKRIDFVIRVARRILDCDPDTSLAFVYIGDGPIMSELRELAAQLELDSSHFTFAGYRNDVRELLPGCDFALHAATGEGFSLAILEYMSAGLVTLVPDVPSVAQAVSHGETGFVYASGDLESAARTLMQLATTPQPDFKRISEAGVELVEQNYTLAATTQAFREVIERQLSDA